MSFARTEKLIFSWGVDYRSYAKVIKYPISHFSR